MNDACNKTNQVPACKLNNETKKKEYVPHALMTRTLKISKFVLRNGKSYWLEAIVAKAAVQRLRQQSVTDRFIWVLVLYTFCLFQRMSAQSHVN